MMDYYTNVSQRLRKHERYGHEDCSSCKSCMEEAADAIEELQARLSEIDAFAAEYGIDGKTMLALAKSQIRTTQDNIKLTEAVERLTQERDATIALHKDCAAELDRMRKENTKMKKYIGVKMIMAEPATKGDCYNGFAKLSQEQAQQEGYKVVYTDGYESWSPKDVFEEAYRSVKGCSFGLALEAVKKGKGMRLSAWQPDVVIRVQFPDEHSKMTAPYLYVESRFGRVPWKETMIELFSDAWEIVD